MYAIPHLNCGLPHLLFSPLSGYPLSLPLSYLPFFPHDQPISTCSFYQFLLKTFIQPNFHSQFIHSSLISSLNSHDSSYQLFLCVQTWTFYCCICVSAIVSSAFTYADVTHELSTFPLGLRDMRPYPITSSTFLQTFAPAVILIVTKANDLVDFARLIDISYSQEG